MHTPAISSESNQRLLSLDVIRGFAILGILLMNIQNYSMIGQAYLNPMAYGDLTGINKWVWIVSHVVADQKFMSIFSMLFGASIILITQSAEKKMGNSLGIHYRRNFWLLVLGLTHAYLIWYGDILTPYAFCAFLLYPFRKLSVKKLFIIGTLIFSVSFGLEILIGISLPFFPKDAIAELNAAWKPSTELIEKEVNAYLGSFAEQQSQREKSAFMMHTTVFLTIFFWRVSGLMLIGMGLFKSGFLSGKLSASFYRKTLLIAGSTGAILVIIGVIKHFKADWAMEYSFFLGSQFNYWGSLGMALSYMSGMILILHKGWLPQLTNRLAAIGRLALSNYLFQSIVCTFIFYGFGLGLFGQVERIFQLFIVIGIWLFQIIISPIWLKHFNYGPFEWLWRSLTQLKWQPMKLLPSK